MFKRSLIATALVLMSASAFAETYPLQVNIQATVPSSNGLVVSPVGDWGSTTQIMQWNPARDQLDRLDRQVFIKSGLGAVNAYLTGGSAPMLTFGDKSIELTVALNGKDLAEGATGAAEVLSSTEAAAGKTVNFSVTADGAPAGGYTAGTYNGVIFAMIESSAP